MMRIYRCDTCYQPTGSCLCKPCSVDGCEEKHVSYCATCRQPVCELHRVTSGLRDYCEVHAPGQERREAA